MSNLADFLLARITEDEAVAHEAIAERSSIDFIEPPEVPDLSFVAWEDLAVPAVVVGPERVLAECEAKRRIATAYDSPSLSAQWLLGVLALPYADHPDYRPEWKP